MDRIKRILYLSPMQAAKVHSWRNARRHKFAWLGPNVQKAKLWGCFMTGGGAKNYNDNYKWAPSREFVSSSIPSWQILTAHAQPFRGARDLAFCLKVPLDSLFIWASSEGSGETARMRRLAWTFAARISDKYQIRLARPICLNRYLVCNLLQCNRFM